MKYAITGLKGVVLEVVDQEPSAGFQYTEITEQQAQEITESQSRYFIVEGQPMNGDDARRLFRQKAAFDSNPYKEKELKRQQIAKARYNAVEGGTTVNGIPVRTDAQTRNELAIARQFAKDDPDLTVEWKLGDGHFVTLDSATIIAIADAVLAHQQAQFAKEKSLNAMIDAATTSEDLNAISY